MNEQDLIDKLRAIQALYHRASTPGERDAAGRAYERVLGRLEQERASEPVEFKFTFADSYKRRLFVALVRKLGLRPYRYHRQRHTTVMVRVPEEVVDRVLWPQYEQLAETLEDFLDEVTNRVIAEGVHGETGEAEVAPQLGG